MVLFILIRIYIVLILDYAIPPTTTTTSPTAPTTLSLKTIFLFPVLVTCLGVTMDQLGGLKNEESTRHYLYIPNSQQASFRTVI